MTNHRTEGREARRAMARPRGDPVSHGARPGAGPPIDAIACLVRMCELRGVGNEEFGWSEPLARSQP